MFKSERYSKTRSFATLDMQGPADFFFGVAVLVLHCLLWFFCSHMSLNEFSVGSQGNDNAFEEVVGQLNNRRRLLRVIASPPNSPLQTSAGAV